MELGALSRANWSQMIRVVAKGPQVGRTQRAGTGAIAGRGAEDVGSRGRAIVAQSFSDALYLHPNRTPDWDAFGGKHFPHLGTGGFRAASHYRRQSEDGGRHGPTDSNEPGLVRGASIHSASFTKRFGEAETEHYLFPFGKPTPSDPSRNITDVTGAWKGLRKTAGVPESTMLALMGHMSRAMLERYSHIRIAAKRTAMDSLMLNREDSDGVPTKVPTALNPVTIQ